MKKFQSIFRICFFALILIFSAGPSLVAGEEKEPEKEKISKKSPTEKDGGKSRGKIEEIKEGVREVGRETKNAFKDLPAQAGKEFRNTGKALKETGKELKESTKEAVEDLKKFFKK